MLINNGNINNEFSKRTDREDSMFIKVDEYEEKEQRAIEREQLRKSNIPHFHKDKIFLILIIF